MPGCGRLMGRDQVWCKGRTLLGMQHTECSEEITEEMTKRSRKKRAGFDVCDLCVGKASLERQRRRQ